MVAAATTSGGGGGVTSWLCGRVRTRPRCRGAVNRPFFGSNNQLERLRRFLALGQDHTTKPAKPEQTRVSSETVCERAQRTRKTARRLDNNNPGNPHNPTNEEAQQDNASMIFSPPRRVKAPRVAGSTPLAMMTPRSRPAAGGIVPDDTPPRAGYEYGAGASGGGENGQQEQQEQQDDYASYEDHTSYDDYQFCGEPVQTPAQVSVPAQIPGSAGSLGKLLVLDFEDSARHRVELELQDLKRDLTISQQQGIATVKESRPARRRSRPRSHTSRSTHPHSHSRGPWGHDGAIASPEAQRRTRASANRSTVDRAILWAKREGGERKARELKARAEVARALRESEDDCESRISSVSERERERLENSRSFRGGSFSGGGGGGTDRRRRNGNG